MTTDKKPSSIHICVLVHGLWGNPAHLNYISNSLREKFPEESLHVFLPKRNAGSFTYDGIELGGERVAHEVLEEIDNLEKDGKKVEKFSIVGYSLGGLVARYSVGLLHSKGLFDKLQATNFTTFATPHLGVRTPLLGWHSQVWNTLGANTLSASGRQLFTIDKFRDSERPLLSVMADPKSIFLEGLSAFTHRTLYANIINDRSVPYYTAAFSPIDPFIDLEAIKIKYAPDYDGVILEESIPEVVNKQELTWAETISSTARTVATKAPLYAGLSVLAPIGAVAFLLNSGYQSYQSAARIRLHEEGKGGIEKGTYQLPLMIEKAKQKADAVFEEVNQAQREEFLEPKPRKSSSKAEDTSDQDDESMDELAVTTSHDQSHAPTSVPETYEEKPIEEKDLPQNDSEFPLLALSPEQFAMIDALNKVGFDKYPVHIQKATHSHAAIIVRSARASFEDGKVVAKHWLDRFEL